MPMFEKFDALFSADTSTPKKRARALISTRIADVLQLLGSGYSERTIALALADDLDVSSDFVLRVLRKHRKQVAQDAPAVPSAVDATKTQQEPAKQSKPTVKERPHVPAAVPTQKTEQKSATEPTRVTADPSMHQPLELPPWADGSDRLPDESEAQYILRKNLEGDPKERRKFIGEHNA